MKHRSTQTLLETSTAVNETLLDRCTEVDAMRVHIELDQCEGHGLCAATAPDLYDLDDDGFAANADFEVPDALIADAESGVSACPMSAIRLLAG